MPPAPLIWLLIAIFALVIFVDLFCLSAACADGPSSMEGPTCTPDANAETVAGCDRLHNLCQLANGEKVRVAIRSNRARNETGVWLEKGVPYTARYVERNDWRDGKCAVEPKGFRFEKNLIGQPRFRWAEWMRPYPQGIWFQVVGRIDRDRNVFPILDPKNAGKPYEFKPPVSGELVLLVNDTIYWNNHGVMTIEIRRCRADEP